MTEHNAHTGVYTVSDLVEKMFGELNKFPLSTKIFYSFFSRWKTIQKIFLPAKNGLLKIHEIPSPVRLNNKDYGKQIKSKIILYTHTDNNSITVRMANISLLPISRELLLIKSYSHSLPGEEKKKILQLSDNPVVFSA